MADSIRIANIGKKQNGSGKSQPDQRLVASIPEHPQVALKRIINTDQNRFIGTIGKTGLFLLKIAILEAVRRFSKAHCPSLWHGLQALQVACLPPLKWLQRWGVFRGLIGFLQALSRPILFLSVATSLSDRTSHIEGSSGSSDVSQAEIDPQLDSSDNAQAAGSRYGEGATQHLVSEKWVSQLFAELAKEGIALPERFTEDELRRFYDASNRDFSCFLASVRKAIHWRKSFRFLSIQALEEWSDVVFWHGSDVKGHPCLIVRVAPACSHIISEEGSRLPEVVVSQIEYAILHLVPAEDPLVTVLMDCEGLTPFRFPLQMMRSCAVLLQDYYPNRLAALFVVRLPPMARMIAMTLFQVLRPGTRQKLQILGDNYLKFLSEYLQTLPSFLGGDCSCPKCSKLINEDNNVAQPSIEVEADSALAPLIAYQAEDVESIKCRRVLKTIVLSLLVVLLSIMFTVWIHDLDVLRF